MKKLLLLPIFTLLFLSITTFASAGWEITQLTTNSYFERAPRINANGHVVWCGNGGSDNGLDLEIFYYDGTTVTQLTTNSYNDYYPKINANGHVVWSGLDGSDFLGGNYQIYYYDGTSVTQLTSDENEQVDPQINDNGHVVWMDLTGDEIGDDVSMDGEIIYYDSFSARQLTDNFYGDYYPQISANDHVVWVGNEGPQAVGDGEIYYYGSNHGGVYRLTYNSYDDQLPQVNANGHVVWEGFDGTDWEIFYHDGGPIADIIQLTDNTVEDAWPQINDNGHVVWDGWDGTDQEIFYYNGSTVTQLTNNSVGDWEPQINANGHVVWQVRSDTIVDIFYYDGRTITQLTNSINNINDIEIYPKINANGHVVWHGEGGSDNGTDTEIFLAKYVFDTDKDGILDDGDNSTIEGDNPCTGGSTANCDDNCPDTWNAEQLDADNDTIGDVCDDTPGCGGCGEPACEKSLTEKVEELLTHYYLNILGRTPDSGGFAYWRDRIISLVSSGGDIKEGFISMAQAYFYSQEYLDRDRDDEEYATDLYNTFFDRPPDSGGLNYWETQLFQGMSRSVVLDNFVYSAEFNTFMDELFFGVS